MKRKTFVQSTVASLLAGLSVGERANAAATSTIAKRPNILYIMVDQFRFPTVFPEGVRSAAEFLENFMPNTYALWQHGVKFAAPKADGSSSITIRATRGPKRCSTCC